MWVRRDEYFGITPPLGLCYLASILEDHKVTIINAQEFGETGNNIIGKYKRIGLSSLEILEKIKQTHPDIVGITCPLSIMWNDVATISRLVKKELDCKVIIGGFQPSAFPEQCLNESQADHVVVGEGEIAFKDIVEGCQEKIVKRPLIKDLDTIPFPARHLIDMEKYIKMGMAQGSQKRERYTTMISSRGCPNNCSFCSAKVVWTRRWRARSAENVVAEIEHLKEKYRINEIHFEDDNISLDHNRMNKICDLIIEKNLDITWTMPNGIEVRTLDKELIQKMKKSGCYQLNFGIESGNRHILDDVIGKKIDLEHTKKVIQWSKDAGIFNHGFFICGFPSETKDMIYESLAYAKDSGLDSAYWNIATPYPATELYDMVIGSKDVNSMKLRGCDNDIGSDTLSAEELKVIQKDINQRFFKYGIRKQMNPINIIKKIRSIDDLNFYLRKIKRVIKVW